VPWTTLERIEQYYDAVPRSACRAEDHGPLTLFVNRRRGWPYYARPRRDRPAPVSAEHVRRVRARQRALGVPEAFEWVAEVTPTLRAAAAEAGLAVREHPLLALDRAAWPPLPPPPGVTVRLAGPRSTDLPLLRSVATLAFGEPGTAAGPVGRRELLAAAAAVPEAGVSDTRERLRAGLTVIAAAYDEEGPLAVGSHQPVGGVTEIAGVGTLPAARRRGLAAAVTGELVRDALERGLEVVFLTAADEEVARIYRRLGFGRIATALIAEPPPPPLPVR
jgi:ribosomal protein S18 acetylase RimI-like enzyme